MPFQIIAESIKTYPVLEFKQCSDRKSEWKNLFWVICTYSYYNPGNK